MAKKIADGKEMTTPTLSLKLSKMNYHIWSMSMEVYLDSHDLWQAIIGDSVSKKKDGLAPLEIINSVPKDL